MMSKHVQGVSVVGGALLAVAMMIAPARAQEETNEAAPAAGAVGETVWAEGKAGMLVRGLDGGLYEPYAAATIERVQQALDGQGLYDGPVNGVLDGPTMTAIREFQEANNLSPSGVPSPRTRAAILGPETSS